MRYFRLFPLLAASFASVAHSHVAPTKQHGLSLRSVTHLMHIGMNNNEIQDWTNEMFRISFREKDKNQGTPKAKKRTRKCGDGWRELLTTLLDNLDSDSKQMVIGQLDANRLTLFAGNEAEKVFDVGNIPLPVQLVAYTCLSLRQQGDIRPTILCAKNSKQRDILVNSLHEAILCKQTGVHGSLPEEPGPELVAEAVTTAEEEKPSGINLHIANSPLGKPQIMINGMTIQEMEKAEEEKVVADIEPKPPSPSISDIPPIVDNEPQDPSNNVNAMNKPKSQDEVDALLESEAEQGWRSADDPDIPAYGYERTKEGYNKHVLNK